MSKMPVMPIFTDVLIGDTTHLSSEEFGAYCLIMFATWNNSGKPFPDDDDRMARVCRVSAVRWRSKIRPILVSFFDLSDGFWRQKRLEKEWNSCAKHKASQSENGKRSAAARALKTQETISTTVDDRLQPNVNQTSTPLANKKEEEETSLREAKKKTKDFNQSKGSRWHAGQPFPTEWLTEANQIRSEHHLAPIDPEYEAAQFADYWAGKSGELGVKLDWHATWRNWVRKAKANGYAPPTNQNGHDKPLAGYGPSHLSTRIEDGYWRNRLIAFKERGYWASEWGFRPDDPPCYAPAHLLAEFGYPIPEPVHGGDER